jgi:transposase
MNDHDRPTEVLHQHYGQMLGLGKYWYVSGVMLDVKAKRLEVNVSEVGEGGCDCPECERCCKLHDHAPERRWRHLDAMGFETIILSRLPRVTCPDHGVKTVRPPWASPHSRFTAAFESLAILTLQACHSIEAAANLLGLTWQTLQGIMTRAVERGLIRRDLTKVKALGFDEKSFRRAQSYIAHMCDLDQHRVLEVVEGRDQAAAQELWRSLPEAVSSRVLNAVMDMSAGFAAASRVEAPQARITFDKYHIVSHLNKAVDQTRRDEQKELRAEGDELLTGMRWFFLTNPAHLTEPQQKTFDELLTHSLRTGQVWAYKEIFTEFWDQPDRTSAKTFLDRWLHRVKRTKHKYLKKVAEMIQRHEQGILNYFDGRYTNAVCEGFNSKIQSLKSAARGFRSFENYRIRILFFLGRLDLSLAPGH